MVLRKTTTIGRMAPRTPPPATLRDVAERSGFSVSQVSRVLAGEGSATPQARAAIRAAADELGYRRGTNGGRPPAPQPRLIELALGQFEGGWADDVVAGTRAAATRLGYDLVLTAEREQAGRRLARTGRRAAVGGCRARTHPPDDGAAAHPAGCRHPDRSARAAGRPALGSSERGGDRPSGWLRRRPTTRPHRCRPLRDRDRRHQLPLRPSPRRRLPGGAGRVRARARRSTRWRAAGSPKTPTAPCYPC